MTKVSLLKKSIECSWDKNMENFTSPLRNGALRTPDAAFANVPNYPWPGSYISELPSLCGLRMHYLDLSTGNGKTTTTYLCLHGNPAWSYLYRKMIPRLISKGARVVAPDMVGFGKSDKPVEDHFHTFNWHRNCLLELIEHLDLNNIVLVVQDWGGILGLTLPMVAPQRYKGLIVMNTTLATGQEPLSDGFKAWREMCNAKPDFDIARLFSRSDGTLTTEECEAYAAPFPDSAHRAATRAFPRLVPEFSTSAGADISSAALNFWRTEWSGITLMAIGAKDPVLGVATMQNLQRIIRHCTNPMVLPEAGHFVQEHGEVIAQRALEIFN
jgi:tRNA(adenine34) deaminase